MSYTFLAMAMYMVAASNVTSDDAGSTINNGANNTRTTLKQNNYHNMSELLNLQDVMTMKPEELPTIDEGYYTNLATHKGNTEPFVMDIPERLEDAYNLGDQYMKRLMNRGQLPPDFQEHKVNRNQPKFHPSVFRLTAYDCKKAY